MEGVQSGAVAVRYRRLLGGIRVEPIFPCLIVTFTVNDYYIHNTFTVDESHIHITVTGNDYHCLFVCLFGV